jgi:hypothetical protein
MALEALERKNGLFRRFWGYLGISEWLEALAQKNRGSCEVSKKIMDSWGVWSS